MRKVGVFPRLSYAIVVIVSVVLASLAAIDIVLVLAKTYLFSQRLSSVAYQLALLLAFLFPGIRALARLARRQQLLSASELDQKIYVIVVTVLGAIGHFFALNVAIAYFQIVVQGRDGSGVGFGVAVVGLWYLTALWIGEFVIMSVTNRVSTEPPKVSPN